MMQLMVENQDTMSLGELVPVGALFGAMLDGHDAFSTELRHQFDKARKLWEQKLRPALLRSAGLTDEQMRALPPDNPQVRRFRTDEQIIGTLVLSALAPEAETLRALTARRLAALNYGTIKVPIKDRRYEMIAPKVQHHGDIALLTFNLINYGKLADRPEAVPTRWNSTEVYSRIAGKWRIVHSHWSYTKAELKQTRS